VLDEGVIVEIVRPGTGDPVPEGEVGELVVTAQPDYPLVRFGTGDLSAVLPAPARPGAPTPASRAGWAAPTRPPRSAACSCIPGQVAEIAKRFPEVVQGPAGGERRDGQRQMTLRSKALRWPDGLVAKIGEAIRDVTKLRGDVELVSARQPAQ
jgi:phenylacetate-CoA ligase